MKQWDIQPYSKIGELEFGFSREKVRELLSDKFSSFKRTQEANETDFFESAGILLSFDNEDKLEFVELVQPANPTYHEIEFLKTSVNDVLRKMTDLGFEPVEDDVGYNFEELGIGLYIVAGVIEAVSVYQRGYYD